MALKSVLITGCSAGGIGSALAEAFQKRNLHVFATARTPSKMSHLEKLPNVTLLTLDVTSASSIAAAVEAVRAKTGGKLDYLVNNSGRGFVMPTLDVNMEEAKRIFDVNFWAVLAVTQAFAPLLIAAQGTIVNISSLIGHLNVVWMGVYGASKSALEVLGETLRLEMVPFGVQVVTVVTGGVKTNLATNIPDLKLPSASRYLPAEERIVARAKGEGNQSWMESKEYADKVVGDLLRGVNGMIWRGKMASFVRYASTYMPTFLLDAMMMKGTGLDTLRKTG